MNNRPPSDPRCAKGQADHEQVDRDSEHSHENDLPVRGCETIAAVRRIRPDLPEDRSIVSQDHPHEQDDGDEGPQS